MSTNIVTNNNCNATTNSINYDGDEFLETTLNPEEECLARHRKERKEFQAEVQKLKQNATKGDKKKKKDVIAQIAILECQMEERHQKELEMAKSELKATELAKNMNKLHLNNEKISSSCSIENAVSNSVKDQMPKISKSQKRKAKKQQKENETNERIKLAENEVSNRVIEESKFKQLLDLRNLQMYPIPSDGDCMYASFVHQLSLHNIQTNVATLRCQASSYMKLHINEFLPFFVHEDTGDLFTPDEFLDYCHKVEHTSEWGGQAELRALSDVLGMCIEIIQADVPSQFVGLQFKDRLSIIVTYHKYAYGLGEHYNSVCLKVESPEDVLLGNDP